MIKNNRPYTIGVKCSGSLITDFFKTAEEDNIAIVGKWIKENIRKSRSVCSRSSYGIKHILEKDVGIYLTNNQMKDALLLAGYYPINPDELNWRYKISLACDINFNPNPFLIWLKQFNKEDSPFGNFAEDALYDFNFPVFANYEIIKKYLEDVSACNEAMMTFKQLWAKYTEKSNSCNS